MSMEEPKPKKAKTDDDESNENKDETQEGEAGVSVLHTDEGEAYFELDGHKRRVMARKYKGKVYVDIREVRTAELTV